MSGSPVYIDGKLVGAVALRLSVFSPDAICGITPIELMLEINDFDESRPADARTPDKSLAQRAAAAIPGDLLAQVVAAGAAGDLRAEPHDDPHRDAADASPASRRDAARVRPMFQQLGVQRRAGRRRRRDVHAPSPRRAGRTR